MTLRHHIASCLMWSTKLRKKLGDLPAKKQDAVIKLADGTLSDRSFSTVQLKIKTCDTQPVSVKFVVIKGQNSLLGRNALEQLWPHEDGALHQNAMDSAAAMSFKKPQLVQNSNQQIKQVAVKSSHQSASALTRTKTEVKKLQ